MESIQGHLNEVKWRAMAVLLGTIKAIMKESIGTIESMAKESMYQAKENSLRDHGKMAIDKAKESSHLR